MLVGFIKHNIKQENEESRNNKRGHSNRSIFMTNTCFIKILLSSFRISVLSRFSSGTGRNVIYIKANNNQYLPAETIIYL